MKTAKRVVALAGGILGLVVVVAIVAQTSRVLVQSSKQSLKELSANDPSLELLLPRQTGPVDVLFSKSSAPNARQMEANLAVKKSIEGHSVQVFAPLPGLQDGIEIGLRDRTLAFGDGERLGPAKTFQVHDPKRAGGSANVGYTWVSKQVATHNDGLEVRSVTLSGIAKQNRCRLSVKVQKMANGALLRDELSDLEYACGY